MKTQIQSFLHTECSWRNTLYWYDSIDSTNTKAKALAREGAPHGTVVLAGHQSAGRGRMGRSFTSEAGAGVYLSVILRHACPPSRLMHLTCAVAIAACQAVEQASGVRPGIKWINDLILENKKLGGILTELSIDPGTGLVDYAIVGIGINCLQSEGDFPAPLDQIATSLKMVTGRHISPARLAAAMIEALEDTDRRLLPEKAAIMAQYKDECMTLGREIMLVRADTVRYAKAVDLDENGTLLAQFPDGSTEWIQSGEASIRGMFGYV